MGKRQRGRKGEKEEGREEREREREEEEIARERERERPVGLADTDTHTLSTFSRSYTLTQGTQEGDGILACMLNTIGSSTREGGMHIV